MNSLRSIMVVFILILCALFLILFRNDVGLFFERVHLSVRGITDDSFSYETFLSLKRHHILSSSMDSFTIIDSTQKNLLRASVYSRYPFTNRGLVVIARGFKDGVQVGMPVLSSEGALIGIVRTVHNSQSEVQTIFDPEWRNSVAIGEKKVKAVMHGGNVPQLELIPKDEVIAIGSNVVNVSPELPFNVPIGTIGNVEFSNNDAWQRAILIPYVISNETEEVFIDTDFP